MRLWSRQIEHFLVAPVPYHEEFALWFLWTFPWEPKFAQSRCDQRWWFFSWKMDSRRGRRENFVTFSWRLWYDGKMVGRNELKMGDLCHIKYKTTVWPVIDNYDEHGNPTKLGLLPAGEMVVFLYHLDISKNFSVYLSRFGQCQINNAVVTRWSQWQIK